MPADSARFTEVAPQDGIGIIACSSYTPRYALTRAAARAAWPALAMPTSSIAVAGLDEDVITMAAHAALDVLDKAQLTGADLDGVVFASTSSPYVVKSAAATVADFIRARPSTLLLDLGAGAHAGLLALVTAMQQPDQSRPTLVVAADACAGLPSDVSDLGFGAGATAFVVGQGGVARLLHWSSRYSSASNTWQPRGGRFVLRYDDERFERTVGYAAQMRHALTEVLADCDRSPDWYALALVGGGDAQQLLPACAAGQGRIVGCDEVQRTGDTGCANALRNLELAMNAASVGDTIAVQAYGTGAGTVSALFEKTAAPTTTEPAAPEQIELSYVQFAKHRGHLALPSIPSAGSPFAASPAWERGKHFTVGLRGVRCKECGSLNFPERRYCLDCRGQQLDDVPLPRRGTIVTYNLQHIVPIGPEEAPLAVCTVLLDGEPDGRYGGKVAALLTDATLEQVAVGMKVELVPRRGDVDDGLVKYGWKFRPIGGRL